MSRIALALVAALVLFSPQAGAQTKAKDPKDAAAPVPSSKDTRAAKKEPSDQAAPATKTAAEAGNAIPDNYKLNLLIRTTIIAINQANKTGNYSVLRDLAAPGFKNANSVEKISEIFADLRNTKFDLSPVLFYTPKLIRPAGLMENGMLRLTGFFGTQPQRLNFDLAFEDNQGEWLLYGVSIGTQRAPASNAQPGAPASPAGPAPAADAKAPAGAAPQNAKSAAPAKK